MLLPHLGPAGGEVNDGLAIARALHDGGHESHELLGEPALLERIALRLGTKPCRIAGIEPCNGGEQLVAHDIAQVVVAIVGGIVAPVLTTCSEPSLELSALDAQKRANVGAAHGGDGSQQLRATASEK